MLLSLKIACTVLVVLAQVGLVVLVRTASAGTLQKLMRGRGEDLSASLRKFGDDIRNNPLALRSMATFWAICVGIIGIPLLLAIWLP